MNTEINSLRLPWLSLGLLLLLVALAPYTMKFAPFAPHDAADSLHLRRVVLVLFGLLTAVIAFIEFVAALRRSHTDVIALAPFAAVFLTCAVIGWRSYPYWANGVYQVGIGAFPPMDQDPKSLIPMVWIGDLWRLPVLVLYLLCYLAVPALTAVAIMAVWRRRFITSIVIVGNLSLSVVFMLRFSPDYVSWIMD